MNNIYLRSMLKIAMGNEKADTFTKDAGIDPGTFYKILMGEEKPDQETLRKIAAHAKNGVTYQKLCDAIQADEDAVIDDDARDAHYLEHTREEDLEQYFRNISRDCNGDVMDSSIWFLIHMLNELKDQDIWVKDEYRRMYKVEYTGEEPTVGERIYRDVEFSLPDGNLVYTVTGTVSWLPTEEEEIRDCRFQMNAIDKDYRKKTRHERIEEIRQNLKNNDNEEKTCEIPEAVEGYGFYVDDDHLTEAKKYCEDHRDLWPDDLEDPEQYSEYNADPDIHGTWQLVAGIMRSLYGLPFECRKRESGYKGFPEAQMIMIPKGFCDETDPEDKILRECYETASALNIPSFGTVWDIYEKSYSLTPEYPVEGTDMDPELEQFRLKMEEDPGNPDVVVPYVELLNEKSRDATTSDEVNAYLSETQQLEPEDIQDDEVWSFIDEMQERYRSLLKKENLRKLMKEMNEKITENPDSPELYEQYQNVVREYVPFCTYEECNEILDTLVEHSNAAKDYEEVLDLMDRLKEQTVRLDPLQKHPETKQIFHAVKEQYAENPTRKNAESYALCLYLNERYPERIKEMEQLYHQNPYDLSIAEQYASMMNRDVIRHQDYDVPMEKLEAYQKELSTLNERFYSSETIGMSDHNINEYIILEEQMNEQMA